jgi:hypothetical protein
MTAPARLPNAARATAVEVLLLLASLILVLAGCDSANNTPPAVPDQITYDLDAQANDGAAPAGISGTVTFWRAGPDSTLVTVDLDENATLARVSHPVHIHANSASDGGGIEFYLSAVNGSSPTGTSARMIGRSMAFFADLDGHVNVHQSPAARDIVVAQGDIGANAQGREGPGLETVENPRTETYSLSPRATEGRVLSEGVSGTVRMEELTASKTLVTYTLNTGGSVAEATGTDVTVAPIGHIHENRLAETGAVVRDPFSGYLGSVAPNDPAGASSRVVNASFDVLTSYDGYVNVHQSNANAQYVFAQGNIGANATSAGNEIDATITLDNVGTSAWEVTRVRGATGVAQTGVQNPAVTLTVGHRYRIDNDAGIAAHPFAVKTATEGDYLLRQEPDLQGRLEENADINYVEDAEGVIFTYTQTLADSVAAYRCTFHGAMEGAVRARDDSNDGSGY